MLLTPLARVPFAPGVAAVLGLFFLAMFVASAFQLLVISYGAEVFAIDQVGYVAGLASGAYGAGLAALMPLFGWLFDRQWYALAFALAAAAPLVGSAAFFALARRVPDPFAGRREPLRRR